MLKNVLVKVNEWDNEVDGDTFDLSDLQTSFSFSMECHEDDDIEMQESLAMDIVSNMTGWCIKDCTISFV